MAKVVSGWYGSMSRLRWSAIFGGAVVTLGIWALLYSLGMAAGLTAIDPSDPGSLRGVGIGTGVWSIVAPLIALFCGGFITARTAGAINRGVGAIHGGVMWALTTIVGALVITMVVAATVRAGARIGAAAVTGAAGLISGSGAAGEAVGLNLDDAVAPINERLQQQGLPPVTSEQMQAATRDALRTAVRTGRLDREMLVSSIAQNTRLSRSDAEQLAASIEQQWNQRVAPLGGQVQRGALQAAETAGRAMWGLFFALFLGLCSAVAGAVTGVSRHQREEYARVEVLPEEAVPTHPGPIAPAPSRA